MRIISFKLTFFLEPVDSNEVVEGSMLRLLRAEVVEEDEISFKPVSRSRILASLDESPSSFRSDQVKDSKA